jgi:hypothetical protein
MEPSSALRRAWSKPVLWRAGPRSWTRVAQPPTWVIHESSRLSATICGNLAHIFKRCVGGRTSYQDSRTAAHSTFEDKNSSLSRHAKRRLLNAR